MALGISELRKRAGPYAAELRRRLRRRLVSPGIGAPLRNWRRGRLLVAPSDLRTGDSFIADEIYAGRFALAGRLLETGGVSPFEIILPSDEFARELHSFQWLRHLRAAGHELASANARALTTDWIKAEGRMLAGVVWEEDVAARRLIAWFSHAPVMLKGADPVFHRRFLAAVSVHIRYLRRMAAVAPDGAARLRVRIALALATLALPASQGQIRVAARRLDAEIERQILSDGGHVSRNPQALVDLLTDLLSLRQTYVHLGHGSPGKLISAIDRMFPALRFFRHADGEVALFNGASAVPADQLLSVLRHDETSGAPFRYLPHLKFQRLSAGPTIIIADCGPPPPGALSSRAHGGCLSFEMSSGGYRLIVNSGVPPFGRDNYLRFARSSAAHSTVILDDTSSGRLSRSRFLGPIMAEGVESVMVANGDGEDGSRAFTATHDGYAALFGLYHERRIRLSADGLVVNGRDRFHRADGAPDEADRHQAIARFHIHPKVRIERGGAHDVTLIAPDGSRWTFLCLDTFAEIQDDVFFADIAGARKAQQIVLAFHLPETPEIQWTLSRA